MKSILSFLICLFITSLLGINAQQVSVIKEYYNGRINTICFTKSGEILLSGTQSGMPLLVKLDTNGNEIFRYTYNEPQIKKSKNVTSFFRVTVDHDDNIYLYTAHEAFEPIHYGEVNPYIVKMDKDGNPIWVSDKIPSNTEYSYNGFSGIIIMYDSTLKVFSNGHKAILDKNTGDILNFDSLGLFSIAEHQNPLWYNGYQWLSGEDQFTYFDSAGNILHKHHNKGYIPFWHMNELGVYSFETRFFRISETPPITNYSKAYILNYDTSLSNLTEIDITPKYLNLIRDTVYCYIGNMICHPQKGVVSIGAIGYGNNPNRANAWIFQADSNTYDIKYDTVINEFLQYGLDKLISYGNTIIAVGTTGIQLGSRVYKISLPDIDTYPPTNTEELKVDDSKTQVYPNPSSSGTFEIRSQSKIKEVRVYALNGSLVVQQHINAEQTNFVLAEQGVYIVQLHFANGEYETSRVIKL